MLFHSTIRKELTRSFGATLVVLITVVMTMMLIRTLGLAARGSVNPSEVMVVMAYTLLGQLPTILGLSLFIAIVGSLSRMYRDSEMAIWFSSGRGLASFLRPLFGFAWPVLLLIAVLSLVAWPWSNQQVQEMRSRYEKRSDIDRIAPGQFQESANGGRVFFIERDTPDKQSGNNIFISATDPGGQAITSARSAQLTTITGERFALLHDGQRLERSAPQSNAKISSVKISEFVTYGTRIGTGGQTDADAPPPRALSTRQLLAAPNASYLGELSWRLGLGLAAVNFVLMALSISSVNPRAGRSGHLALALFAFIVYYNLLNLGQSWIGSGRLPIAGFVLALHGGVLVASLLLLGARHNHWSWRQLVAGKRRVRAT